MSNNRGKKFFELLDELGKIPGAKIHRMLDHLATSLYTANRNYLELSAAIGKYEKDLSIWAVKNRPQLNAFLREYSRLLHNYLSSIYSLIEHTRIVQRELDHPELNRAYSSELKALVSNDCVRFVKDLRTYSQHIGLPFVTATLSYRRTPETRGGTIKQQILLDKKELLKWKKWHRKSRNYVIPRKEINMKVILVEYQTRNKKFYKSFYNKVGKLYSKELQEFMKIRSELARLG